MTDWFNNDDNWFDYVAAGANYNLAHGKYKYKLNKLFWYPIRYTDMEFPSDSIKLMSWKEFYGEEDGRKNID